MISISNDLHKLKYLDFDIKNIEAYKIANETATIDYTVTPRKSNLLHFIIDGEREYEINGEKFMVRSNTLIFIPNNTKYKTRAFEGNVGTGICFDGNIFEDEKDLTIYCKDKLSQNAKIKNLFSQVLFLFNTIPRDLLSIKKAIIEIFSFLSDSEITEEYSLIKDAVSFINENYKKNLPVKTYAEQCNLSESYFRKKFSDLFGKSPVEYRNELRFAEAKRLYGQNYSSEEIAEILGFCDSRYMLRLYKKLTGKSLKEDAQII